MSSESTKSSVTTPQPGDTSTSDARRGSDTVVEFVSPPGEADSSPLAPVQVEKGDTASLLVFLFTIVSQLVLMCATLYIGVDGVAVYKDTDIRPPPHVSHLATYAAPNLLIANAVLLFVSILVACIGAALQRKVPLYMYLVLLVIVTAMYVASLVMSFSQVHGTAASIGANIRDAITTGDDQQLERIHQLQEWGTCCGPQGDHSPQDYLLFPNTSSGYATCEECNVDVERVFGGRERGFCYRQARSAAGDQGGVKAVYALPISCCPLNFPQECASPRRNESCMSGSEDTKGGQGLTGCGQYAATRRWDVTFRTGVLSALALVMQVLVIVITDRYIVAITQRLKYFLYPIYDIGKCW